MQRDPRAYLWDAKGAADDILAFVRDRTFDDYATDRMLRSAVERQFEIIGEALNQLSKLNPDLGDRVPDLPQIVAFRNLLVHGYASVDHGRVWRTVQETLPDLMKAVSNMLRELDAHGS